MAAVCLNDVWSDDGSFLRWQNKIGSPSGNIQAFQQLIARGNGSSRRATTV
jgi:hypothetical protein